MGSINQGFEVNHLNALKSELENSGKNYQVVESNDNSDEYVNFHFIGMYEGKEVIYDAAIYTLRLHHASELYEVAEHRAAKHFPEFKRIKYEEDENGDMETLDDLEEEIGLFMAEVITELEAEDEIKVSEHVEIDDKIEFGVGLDAALNVETVSEEVITRFIDDYNEDNIELDPTAYSFHLQEEET